MTKFVEIKCDGRSVFVNLDYVYAIEEMADDFYFLQLSASAIGGTNKHDSYKITQKEWTKITSMLAQSTK